MIFSVVYNNGAKVEFESPGQAKSGNWEGIGSFGWGVSSLGSKALKHGVNQLCSLL